MMPRERVQCHACLQDRPIRSDGTMAKHRLYLVWPSVWEVCTGSWEPPGRHRLRIDAREES